MTAFWTHLQRLAQGQLFNGGYLRADDASRAAAADATAKAAGSDSRTIDRKRRPRTGQVATCQ
jgi:hypothetical protein